MPLKVIKGKFRDGENKYGPGDILPKLSKEEEAYLVESGAAEYVEKAGSIESKKETSLEKMKRDELVKIAEGLGIKDIPETATKPELIKGITDAKAAQAEE